jgi:hypothetical protein
MDKANDLFHEIVVDKSREIYENLIAEEDDEMEEESADMDDESVEEADDMEDESVEENMDQEDAYEANDFDQTDDDATGDLGQEIGADDEEGGEEFGGDDEGSEDSAIMDIKNAIQELEAAFAELEQAHGSDEDEMGFGDEEGEMGMDDEEPEDEMMGQPAFEGRRMTREYVEKVGNDWEKNSQKTQGQYAGSGSGEKDGAPQEGKSPIASGKNKPGPAGVNAKNLNQGATEGQSNTGTSPGKVNKGITPEKSEQFTGKEWETNSKAGGNAGVKNLKKVGAGYPGNNKNPGPVGSGSGDKAGQTSIDAATKKQFLPQYK